MIPTRQFIVLIGSALLALAVLVWSVLDSGERHYEDRRIERAQIEERVREGYLDQYGFKAIALSRVWSSSHTYTVMMPDGRVGEVIVYYDRDGELRFRLSHGDY